MVMGWLLQSVVGGEVVRTDDHVALLQVGGQRDDGRRRLRALLALAGKGEANGIRMRHVARQRVLHRGGEFFDRAVLVQALQGGGDRAEVVAANGGAHQHAYFGDRDRSFRFIVTDRFGAS